MPFQSKTEILANAKKSLLRLRSRSLGTIPKKGMVIGMIKGICHPGDDFNSIKECGFTWVRTDCPFPYENGEILSEKYIQYKEKCREHKEFGFKVMSITPNPKHFAKYGAENTADIIEFIARDMKGLVDGWQIANEMNIYFFRAPLSFDKSIDFIAEGLKGVRRVDKDILLGYNFSEYSESSIYMMEKLSDFKELYNYVGYDGYYGTWIKGSPDDYVTAIEKIHKLTGAKVLLQEFGFASVGEIIEPNEFDELMPQYGFEDFEAAKANCEAFLEKIPKRLSDFIKSAPREEWEESLRNLESHMLKKWVGGSSEFPHSEEGQAHFYDVLLSKLMEIPYLIGLMIFCWSDSGTCFFCLEKDCPCETAWGLVTKAGEKKASYYAVKKHLDSVDTR